MPLFGPDKERPIDPRKRDRKLRLNDSRRRSSPPGNEFGFGRGLGFKQDEHLERMGPIKPCKFRTSVSSGVVEASCFTCHLRKRVTAAEASSSQVLNNWIVSTSAVCRRKV